MSSYGVEVERPITPTCLEISNDPNELADPSSHPVKVRSCLQAAISYIYSSIKVLLKRLSGDEGTEVVRAKYVVGADGE